MHGFFLNIVSWLFVAFFLAVISVIVYASFFGSYSFSRYHNLKQQLGQARIHHQVILMHSNALLKRLSYQNQPDYLREQIMMYANMQPAEAQYYPFENEQ